MSRTDGSIMEHLSFGGRLTFDALTPKLEQTGLVTVQHHSRAPGRGRNLV